MYKVVNSIPSLLNTPAGFVSCNQKDEVEYITYLWNSITRKYA